MFKLLILATFLAVSNAYLSHGPTILNHPNYGGYSVTDHGVGAHQANYLAPYGHHGVIPAYSRAPLPIPIPAPAPVIQKLGHTGYAYAPSAHLPIAHAPVDLPQLQPNAYAHAGYHAGAQSSYGHAPFVVAPGISFSQTAPKQIAPAIPVSKVVRIPYAFPAINMPHPIPHPIPVRTQVNHGW